MAVGEGLSLRADSLHRVHVLSKESEFGDTGERPKARNLAGRSSEDIELNSFRKPLPAAVCQYQCEACKHTIAVMPYVMEQRQFCSSCGGSFWKFKGVRKGGESNGIGSDKQIDASFHRKMTKQA